MTIHEAYIYSFTAAALALGAAAAWQDYRFGKIKNRLLLAGLAVGAIVYTGFTVALLAAPGGAGASGAYLRDVLLNTSIAFAAAFAMWKSALWSAGDAKLFTVFAFLTPLEYYSRGYMDYFPAFNLLVNIFAVSFAFVVVKILLEAAAPAGKIEPHRAAGAQGLPAAMKFLRENWPQMLLMFTLFNIVMLAVKAAGPAVGGGRAGQLALAAFSLLFIYLAVKPISRKLELFFKERPGARPWTLAVIPAAVTLAIITGNSRAVAGTAKTTAGFMIAVGLLRKIIETRLGKTDVSKVKAADLRKGMLPTQSCLEEISKTVNLGTVFMDGLTGEQADAVRGGLDGETELEIYRTMPFAPAALGGLALTFYLKQSVVHYLIGVFR